MSVGQTGVGVRFQCTGGGGPGWDRDAFDKILGFAHEHLPVGATMELSDATHRWTFDKAAADHEHTWGDWFAYRGGERRHCTDAGCGAFERVQHTAEAI